MPQATGTEPPIPVRQEKTVTVAAMLVLWAVLARICIWRDRGRDVAMHYNNSWFLFLQTPVFSLGLDRPRA